MKVQMIMAAALLAVTQVASTEYLENASGSVVVNSSGECWETSGATNPRTECGDVAPIENLVQEQLDNVVIAPKQFVIAGSGFAFDSAVIPTSMTFQLNTIASENEGAEVSVVGYADQYGEVVYNEALSLRRAQAVADFLADAGMVVVGVAGAGSIDGVTNTKEENAANRKVVVTVN